MCVRDDCCMSDLWIDSWLSGARFQRYVDECSGDRGEALRLYEWNSELSQALMHDISHFEVALRNAYDAAIMQSWPHSTHWLLHPDSPVVTPIWRTREVNGIKRGTDVNEVNRKSVDEAIARCGYGRATPGKVIAELSFGFWRQLTTAAMEKTVWVPYLHRAYPQRTSRRLIDRDIAAINNLRNRIAHHEPLLPTTIDVPATHQAMLACLRTLAPEAHAHVLRTSRVAETLARMH